MSLGRPHDLAKRVLQHRILKSHQKTADWLENVFAEQQIDDGVALRFCEEIPHPDDPSCSTFWDWIAKNRQNVVNRLVDSSRAILEERRRAREDERGIIWPTIIRPFSDLFRTVRGIFS